MKKIIFIERLDRSCILSCATTGISRQNKVLSLQKSTINSFCYLLSKFIHENILTMMAVYLFKTYCLYEIKSRHIKV